MLAEYVDDLVEQYPALEEQGKQLAQTIHEAVLQGGDGVRSAVDLLHGTWLGHPLHPVLTDIVVGSWSLASLFDLLSLNSGSRRKAKRLEETADLLTTIGVVSAVPTALTGLADYSTIPRPAADTGLTHALANTAGLTFYLLSLRARRQGRRQQGITLSVAGLLMAMSGAYLGGHLVFKQRVGVNHNEGGAKPEQWTAVLDEQELVEGEPRRVEIDGEAVLLYRYNGRVCAVGAVCPHAGGPLEEGQFRGAQVQCPWHDSVFDLCNGRIIHGPSTYPIPVYETRRRQGQIEIRAG
jgi:nitrite reductase/ring-hydroxylating ferredoxin subunit/uncharacterized membrane protein